MSIEKIELNIASVEVEEVNESNKLRWIGFDGIKNPIADLSFIDKNKNIWNCSFIINGEQEIYLNKEVLKRKLSDKKFADTIKSFSRVTGIDKTVAFLQNIIDTANSKKFDKDLLYFMDLLNSEKIYEFNSTCWIEAIYKATDKNNNIVLENVSNDEVGIDIQPLSFDELIEYYMDTEFLEKTITTILNEKGINQN